MTDFLTLDDLPDVTGKFVLVRGDIDVPLKDGIITDDTRLMALVPTLSELSQKGAKVILMGHLGRPKGEYDPSLSATPIATALSKILGQTIPMIGDATSQDTAKKAQSLKIAPGPISLNSQQLHF